MDSSYYNRGYGQWGGPFSPRPSSASSAVPPSLPQSYPENPIFYARSSTSGGHHPNHHHYSHPHELLPPPPPPPPVVNQPPFYYSAQKPLPPPPPPLSQQHLRYNPQQLTYESPRISHPSSSSSCTESRVAPQSACVERKDTRPDSWVAVTDAGPGRNYQFDFGRLSRGSSGDGISHRSDGNSRFRDELRSLAYVKEEFGAARIEGNYQDRGQIKSQSGRSFGAGNRGLSSSFGYSNDLRGATVDRCMIRSSGSNGGSGNQRWVVDGKVSNGGRTPFSQKKDDYYHSEIERYFNNGSREDSNELSRTPKKQMQKKSVLLRIETPRPNQKGRDNDRSRHPSYHNENRSNSFRGKDHLGHFDRGLLEKPRGRTPVELDISFKSNVLVAKAVESPATAGASSGVSVTPRTSKVRKVLLTDTDEKASLNGGIAKFDFKSHVTDNTSGSESFKQSERQFSAPEKGSDSHSSPSSVISKDKINEDKSLEGVLFYCGPRTTDKDLEASVDDGAIKVCSSVYSAENVSSFDETLKHSKDEVHSEYGSNLKLRSTGENVFDGDKSILKSDVLNRKGIDSNAGEILLPKVMKAKRIVKKITTPSIFPVSQPTASNIEKLSKCSGGGAPFAGMLMSSTEPQPCEDDVSKNCMGGVSPRNLLMKETDVGFEGRKSLSSSLGPLCFGEKGLDEPSTEAASSCKIVGDQLLAKSGMSNSGGIGDGREGIHQKGDSLSSDDDFSRDCTRDLGFSAGYVKCGTSVVEANNVSGDLANANSFTLESNTTPMADSPEGAIVFQIGSQAFENGVSPSVEGVNINRSMETRLLKKTEGTGGHLGSDARKQAHVSDISSFPKNLAGNGSLNGLTVGRIDGCCLPGACNNWEGLSDESESARAISSEMCVEYVSSDNFVANQDVDLGSLHPAKDPFTDQFSVLGSIGLKAGFSESNVSLSKDINVGPCEFSLEREVTESVPSSCGKVPGSLALVIDNNLAIGNINESGNEKVSGSGCCSPETQPCSEGGTILLENHLGRRSSDAVGSLLDSSTDTDLIKDPSRVSSCLVLDSSATVCHLSPLVPVNERIQGKPSVHTYRKSPDGITDKESGRVENLEVDTQNEKIKLCGKDSEYRSPGTDIVTIGRDSVLQCGSLSTLPGLNIGQSQNATSVAAMVYDTGNIRGSAKDNVLLDALQEQIMTFHEAIQPGNSLEHCPCSGHTSPGTDVESCEPLLSNYSGEGSTEKRNGDPVENLPDVLSDVGSQENSLTIANAGILEVEALAFDGKVSGSDNLGNSDAPASKSLSEADARHVLVNAKRVISLPAPDYKNKALTLSSMSEKTQRKEKTFNDAVQKSCSRSSFAFTGKRKVNPPTRITKPNTWHRKNDTSASSLAATKPSSSTFSTKQKLPQATVQVNTSYVRKGNSLVRKPSRGTPGGVSLGLPPSTLQVNRSVVEEDNMGSVGRTDAEEASSLVKAGENCTPERQSVHLSDNISKISSRIATFSGVHTNDFPESIMDSAISGDAGGEDGLKISESLNQTDNASNCQKIENPTNLASSNPRKILYVKRKSNQLVAASDVHSASKSQIPPSDGYFKRSKNQLVRTSDNHVKQAVLLPDDALDSQAQPSTKIVSKRNFSSVFSGFGAVKRPFKRSKFSLVWTLNDKRSGETNKVHMQCQKILPQFVPWKRVTYWRRLMNSVSVLRNSSFSTVSRKLLLLRQRHTVYTRSTNGFSLRKSKILSTNGSHLKWSKSIERDSKKANEDATLAVAAFAKKKGENHSGQDIIGRKSRNHLARERIFRIGSSRYKMDSSRRTLQRISDVKSPCSGPPESGKDVRKSFIPKRLVIGNDEYVRVGNGNQLVRDPKKRTRVLANEKVRWSLYNVRLRLAKKKKYCQFFTRFGRCNKDDGKCPYIHDPSKIAVCTKFLNGLCINPNCKLTHKVIPERMPDCSYFLQGLCNNEACPYRHVHVNLNAPICEGFLRGYCSDGNECRRKHTNTCPVFEVTGSCPQGSKCKLHHPKNRNRGRKRKRGSEASQKNARGRYFGLVQTGLPESEPMSLDRCATDSAVLGGEEGSDFIRIDGSEDEAGESNGAVTEGAACGDSDGRDSLYKLIRPVGLMQK